MNVPSKIVHVLAFDGTDQAECGAAGDTDRCTDKRDEVNCEYCLGRLDDIGQHP